MIRGPIRNSIITKGIVDQVIVEDPDIFDITETTGILAHKLLTDQDVIQAVIVPIVKMSVVYIIIALPRLDVFDIVKMNIPEALFLLKL